MSNTLIIYPKEGNTYPFDWLPPDDDDPASVLGQPWVPDERSPIYTEEEIEQLAADYEAWESQ